MTGLSSAKSIYLLACAKTLKDMTFHKPSDNVHILLQRGYAILDDKNLHIKIKVEQHNAFDIKIKSEIKNIYNYNKK